MLRSGEPFTEKVPVLELEIVLGDLELMRDDRRAFARIFWLAW